MTSDEERRGSLADQAAAWIPPWQRPTPPDADAAPADADALDGDVDAATAGANPAGGDVDAASAGAEAVDGDVDAASADADTDAAPAGSDVDVDASAPDADAADADATGTAAPATDAALTTGTATSDAATATSATVERAEPEILDTYRSPGTETVQDLAAGGPAPVPPAGPAVIGPGESTGPTDLGETGAGGADAGVIDAGETDAVGADAGRTDADGADAGRTDAGGTEAEPGGAGVDRAGLPATDLDAAGSAGDLPGEGAAAGVPGKRGRRRATPAPEPAPVLDDAELRGALEAILLVVDEPVSELVLAQVLEQPAERVGPMLDEIAAGYTAAGHGFELRRAAGGWRLYTRPEYATYVERFVLDGQSVRLTQAALETLAVIAYKQPVTRSRISAIRGVNCDGVIRTLVSRGLVEECGTEPDSGAFLYRTTTMFLEKLGLNSVTDLPPLAPFLPDDVEELADATR